VVRLNEQRHAAVGGQGLRIELDPDGPGERPFEEDTLLRRLSHATRSRFA
jgi:hypothetical protein